MAGTEIKKFTKKACFTQIMEIVKDNPELVAFCEREIELLNRKNSSKTPTRTQIENEKIMIKIMEVLSEIDKPMTVTELQSASEDMAQYSNQKLSALLKKLVDSNKIVKTVDKKKSYFSMM